MKLQERGGECRLLSRLLAVPPDATVVQDAQTIGLIGAHRKPDLESLHLEYSRLFSVPGPDAVAAHQSIYTDVLEMEPSGPDKLGCGLAFAGGEFRGYLGGQSCAEAKRWYVSAGFKPPDAPAMADHISTQLAFLAHLYLAEAQVCEADEAEDAQAFRELRAGFYARFLGGWIRSFGEKLAVNRVSEFYRGIGSHILMMFQEDV